MASSLALLLSQNWRQMIVALSVQYLAVFWLLSLVLPLGLAAVKLVVGWMAGAVLAASQPSDETFGPQGMLSNNMFRLLSAGMVWLLMFSLATNLDNWLPIRDVLAQGGLLLVGMGLLHLGMTTRPFRMVVGLLTVLSGFEILYATVETSVLVAGLLVFVNLGLALTGAYLIASPAFKEDD
ncbi:MAG: hypothetical protein VB089_12370 [Anaerolineaceae bacterium]|jgi:hypothetical protein|nr:hypothetical protein [Anaerolineaceae bacterium]